MEFNQDYYWIDCISRDRAPQIMASSIISEPKKQVVSRLKPRSVIVLATIDSWEEVIKVFGVGVVQNVNETGATVEWRPIDGVLRPSDEGMSKWQNNPGFRFPNDRAKVYKLDALVRKAFRS